VEKGSVFGLVACCIGVFVGAMADGANIPALFTNAPALLIVLVGSLGATMLAFPFIATASLPKYFKKALLPGPAPVPTDTIELIVKLTNRARTEGLLALDDESKNIEDPFFRRGIQMAVDGTDPAVLAEGLKAEVKAMQERHKLGAAYLTQWGVFAPTFGIIGAVFGLMHVMGDLTDPSKIGAGIAAAFVATFFGVFVANGIFLPMGNKLKTLSTDEVAYRKMLIEGILAIQAGTSPRVVEAVLMAQLPPKLREAAEAKAA
jgi:chemotaxis protein MotA